MNEYGFGGCQENATCPNLDLPAQSPDLNPIEHLWDDMGCRLQPGPNHPTLAPDLTNALVAEWKQVSAAMFQYLGLEAVIAAKRGPTPY
jgi:hypothetical protein